MDLAQPRAEEETKTRFCGCRIGGRISICALQCRSGRTSAHSTYRPGNKYSLPTFGLVLRYPIVPDLAFAWCWHRGIFLALTVLTSQVCP